MPLPWLLAVSNVALNFVDKGVSIFNLVKLFASVALPFIHATHIKAVSNGILKLM